MQAKLPEINIKDSPGDLSALTAEVERAVDSVEWHMALTARLYGRSPENFYGIAEQVKWQIKAIQEYAKQLGNTKARSEVSARLSRASATLSFLMDYPPYVESNGPSGRSLPREKIRSVTSAGLPGLGKRH